MKNKKLETNGENLIKYKNKGITLIALVVTIVVMIILTATAISTINGDGIIGRANEAAFKSNMAAIAEDVAMYNSSLKINNPTSPESALNYNAGDILKEIIQSGTDDSLSQLDANDVVDITTISKKVGKKEKKYVMIYNGEMYYVSQSKLKNNEKQKKWCEEIGIKVWDGYENAESNTGINNIDGNYENVNGIYLCTPKLNEGYNKNYTRYVKTNSNDKLVVGNWISKKPDSDWYDYKNQKWANIYVESSGVESYYVWIPRYVYKLDSGKQRSDVKFVDMDNNYIDTDTNQKTDWATLQSQGYKLPEAFTFADKQIPGYWMSKYQLSELGKYTIDFSTAASATSITIQNISINTTQTIAKYTYALNGRIVHESTSPENYKITGLAKGNKAINVTALNSDGEIIGSMTKLFETAETNAPQLKNEKGEYAFDKDTTFYVYWDENGIEHNEVPISKDAPSEWYDYTSANWANIVTRNNGLETYYVWIPRYAYKLDSTSQRSYVKFLKGTTTKVDAGYKIPEAFWWDKDSDGKRTEDEEIQGYWITKYQLSTEEKTPRINAELSAGSNIIRVKDITGTLIDNANTNGISVKYEYYLNGDLKHTGTEYNENYVFEGLTANTTYTVNIIARNSSTNEFIGATTKKITTNDANAPDVSAFDKETTFYVYWDGDEEKRVSIKKDPPKEWYDYSNQRWANIVTTANNTTTYFTWIPRYEYRILGDRANLDTSNRRIDVTFLPGTTNTADTGYKIPEAFTFNGQELTGYWITKYQLNN